MPDIEQGNPDVGADRELIFSVMKEVLTPIFDAIGTRLSDLEEDLGETRDLLFKLSEGLIGAADGQRRTMLSDELDSKYGADMGPYEDFYKDTMGKGFKESILEELMGEGAPGDDARDEWMKNKLGEAKGKYGKYVGIKAEVEPAAEAKAEGHEEAEASEPEPEAEEVVEEKGKMPGQGIFEEMMNLGGKKGRLSGPMPKGK